MELGQYLYAVNKDKLYRDWGFSTFDLYCAKEIGIKQQTAVKLLRSYYFLEKEEPAYLKDRLPAGQAGAGNGHSPAELPSYESVNALRLAKQSERLSEKDYEKIRAEVLEKGGEPAEVRKKIKYFLKPAAAKQLSETERRAAAAKKLRGQLEQALSEMSNLSFPSKVLRQMEELLDLLAGFK